MVVKIKITLNFIGTGINNEYQACIFIYDKSNKLLYHKKTYNGKTTICLKPNEAYKLIAKSKKEIIHKVFYIDKKTKTITFIFSRSIYNPEKLRTITFLLTDANYYNLPIEKGEIFLCQKQ